MLIEIPVIRVKEFAKVKFLPAENSNNIKEYVNESSRLPIDIETISLSSEEEVRTNKNKKTKCIAQTPKPRGKRLSRFPSTISKSRTPKQTPKYKYHKIDEYFHATKKECKFHYILIIRFSEILITCIKKYLLITAKNECVTINPKQSTSNLLPEKARFAEKQPDVTDAQRYASNLKQVKIVLRRLSIDQQVETSRKRKAQDDQSKLSEFIEYESSKETYFKVYEHSSFPMQPPLQLKMIDIEPNSIDIKCKIEGIDLKSHNDTDNKTSKNIHCIDTSSTIKENEQNFRPQENAINYNLRKKPRKTKNTNSIVKAINKISKDQAKLSKPVAARKSKVECPYYKIVEGTKFAVDAFRYGDIDGVEHYFLTHFHADHYIGLKKSFNHKLYVSKITGRLVMELIKVEHQYIRYLDINTPTEVDGVEVTALDANQ